MLARDNFTPIVGRTISSVFNVFASGWVLRSAGLKGSGHGGSDARRGHQSLASHPSLEPLPGRRPSGCAAGFGTLAIAVEPWIDRPMDDAQLEHLRRRLARMGSGELQRFYEAAHYMSRLDRGEAPRAHSRAAAHAGLAGTGPEAEALEIRVKSAAGQFATKLRHGCIVRTFAESRRAGWFRAAMEL